MLKVKKIKKILESYSEGDDIRASVANEALDQLNNYNDIKAWFSDLLQHGCISGMVGGLVYYIDTHAFYDYHYEEIENLRYEYEEMTGEALNPENDLKNWYAWFAYEETARKLVDELELDK